MNVFILGGFFRVDFPPLKKGHFGRISSTLCFTVSQSLAGHASARRVPREPCFRQAHCFVQGPLRFLPVPPNDDFNPTGARSHFWGFPSGGEPCQIKRGPQPHFGRGVLREVSLPPPPWRPQIYMGTFLSSVRNAQMSTTFRVGEGGKTKFCKQELYGHPDFSDSG